MCAVVNGLVVVFKWFDGVNAWIVACSFKKDVRNTGLCHLIFALCQACASKTRLANRRMGGRGPANSSFGTTPTIVEELCSSEW